MWILWKMNKVGEKNKYLPHHNCVVWVLIFQFLFYSNSIVNLFVVDFWWFYCATINSRALEASIFDSFSSVWYRQFVYSPISYQLVGHRRVIYSIVLFPVFFYARNNRDRDTLDHSMFPKISNFMLFTLLHRASSLITHELPITGVKCERMRASLIIPHSDIR